MGHNMAEGKEYNPLNPLDIARRVVGITHATAANTLQAEPLLDQVNSGTQMNRREFMETGTEMTAAGLLFTHLSDLCGLPRNISTPSLRVRNRKLIANLGGR
jgi:hypothetical protein